MMLERLFQLKSHNTTVKKEVIAGIITFLTMSYILVVNPMILGSTGMDKSALFTGTALAAIAGTVLMALWAKIPVAQAPSMGLNSFFAVTVVQEMGYSWQFALTAVFIVGIISFFLTYFNVREMIVNNIPRTLKSAIPVGIGLFITLIGLKYAGLVVGHSQTLITMGSFSDRGVWIALFGLTVIGVLLAKNVPGAILIGIISATLFSLLLGFTAIPEGSLIQPPPDIAPIFAQFEWSSLLSFDMLMVVFTFLLVNTFDTIGALLSVGAKAGLIDKDGNFPQVRKALLSDSVGTAVCGIVGCSPNATYIESASGVASGGRTGLTALSTTFMFALALFFSPFFLLVPQQAIAPVLIIIGLFMLSSVVEINFNDFTESIPAYLTIIMMPFSYSIAQGIIFGMLSFVTIKLFSGKYKDIKLTVYIISVFFLIKIFMDIFRV